MKKPIYKPFQLILFDVYHILDYLQFQKLCLLKLYLIVFFFLGPCIYHILYHGENKLYQDHSGKYNLYLLSI